MPTYGNADLPYLGSKQAGEASADALNKDPLGLHRYSKALAQFVSHCETPMTIGIQGEWGSGKTSLMNMIQGHIEAEPDKKAEIHFLRFETWQYGALGNDDLLGLHLMRDMTASIASFRPGDGKVVSQSSKLGKLFSVLATATAAGTTSTLSGGLVDGSAMIKGARDAFGAEHARAVGGTDLAHIKRVFGELVANVTVQQGSATKRARNNPTTGRFVICIDDLDRIRPGKAVAMLEVLKNFMDVEHCVFIVACDYDVVRRGVKERLGIEEESKASAFFHKIFQVPFQMPVRQYQLQPWLEQLIQTRMKAAGLVAKSAAAQSSSLAKRLAPMIETATHCNPRAMKRFINVVDLLSCMEKKRSVGQPSVKVKRGADIDSIWCHSDEVAVLMGLVALQTRWPLMVSHLTACQSAEELSRALKVMAGTGDEEDESASEKLNRAMARHYGSPDDEDQSQDGFDLNRFAREFFKALDRNADEQLTGDEAAPVLAWGDTLGLTAVGGARAAGGGWSEFVATVTRLTSGSSFLSIIEALWEARSSLGNGVRIVRRPHRIRVEVIHNNRKISVLEFLPDLTLIVHGNAEKAQKYGFSAWHQHKEQLVDGWQTLGLRRDDEMTRSGGYRYLMGDFDGQVESLSTLRASLVGYLQTLVASSRVMVSPPSDSAIEPVP